MVYVSFTYLPFVWKYCCVLDFTFRVGFVKRIFQIIYYSCDRNCAMRLICVYISSLLLLSDTTNTFCFEDIIGLEGIVVINEGKILPSS